MNGLEDWLLGRLSPRIFFAGLALGFALCCVLGRVAPKLAPIEDAERLHALINPQTLYFPTALQVRAWARRQLPRDKIAVVIGGNSVLQGSGQKLPDVWTRRLQAELGDGYRILNVAVSSGAPTEYGEVVAEMLSRDHPRVIHVCNCNAARFASAPDGSLPTYRYFFHDAQARGLLAPFDERDRALEELRGARLPREPIDELMLQTRANRWLSFNDFWQAFGYHACFTVWTRLAAQHPWQARKRWPDIVNMASGNLTAGQWAIAKRNLLAAARPYTAEDWQSYGSVVEHSIPPPLRPRTMAVLVRPNPKYLARIDAETPGFQARYDDKVQEALGRLRSCGLDAVQAGVTLDVEDYLDTQHLRPSGGAKLAHELAPAIRAQAERLGYVSGEMP